MADSLTDWKELAAQLRVDSIRCTTAAGSGHPTSSMSAADLMVTRWSPMRRSMVIIFEFRSFPYRMYLSIVSHLS